MHNNDIAPVEPRDLCIDDHAPDPAHTEGAHLLADRAQRRLRDAGFTDEQIRHWAYAYIDDEDSGDIQRFIAWISARERRALRPACLTLQGDRHRGAGHRMADADPTSSG
jgi:hypothetical protein